MYNTNYKNYSTWKKYISAQAALSRGYVEPPLSLQLPILISKKRGLEPQNKKPARRKK